MANNLLTNDERFELIEAYKRIKLNAPPANIKDETLIENFGSNEQKARLQTAPAAKTPKAAEAKAAAAKTGGGTAAAGNPAPSPEHGKPAEQTEPAATVNGGDVNPNDLPAGTGTTPPAGEVVNAEAAAKAQAQAAKDAEYVEAFNAYTNTFHKMPKDTLTTAELVKLTAEKLAKIKADEEAKAAQKQKAQEAKLTAEQEVKNQRVTIVDNKTGEETVVQRLTWERFIKKDNTHTVKVAQPKELDNL